MKCLLQYSILRQRNFHHATFRPKINLDEVLDVQVEFALLLITRQGEDRRFFVDDERVIWRAQSKAVRDANCRCKQSMLNSTVRQADAKC